MGERMRLITIAVAAGSVDALIPGRTTIYRKTPAIHSAALDCDRHSP